MEQQTAPSTTSPAPQPDAIGPASFGVGFYEKLANVHTSVVKSLTEGVENAISAEATWVDLCLCRGADLHTAEREMGRMFVVVSDTHIANIRDTLQFAHRPNGKYGALNCFGMGAKVLMASLGPDVQMLVLTKDGARFAAGRMGPSLDRLVGGGNAICRTAVEGHVDADGCVAPYWGDDAPGALAENRFAKGTPWAHKHESAAKALQRMWTPFLKHERVTAFVFYSDGAPLPMDVDGDSGRLRVVEAGEPRDLARALEGLYVAHASLPALPAVTVQGVACDFAHHPALHGGGGEYAPLHVPGLGAPVAWVRCDRLAAARHIDPYHKLDRESGAYFTLGDAKLLNPCAPRTYFTGGTFGLAGAVGSFDLNLAPFDTGNVRPAQYEEVVRFLSCGDADVEARVRRDVDLAKFRTWMPRDAQLWARLGLDVLAHVRVNPALVHVNPQKTEVRLRGEGERATVAMLARLRYHVFAWAVANVEGRAFVPPFAEADPAPLVPYVDPSREKRRRDEAAVIRRVAQRLRDEADEASNRSGTAKLAYRDALLIQVGVSDETLRVQQAAKRAQEKAARATEAMARATEATARAKEATARAEEEAARAEEEAARAEEEAARV